MGRRGVQVRDSVKGDEKMKRRLIALCLTGIMVLASSFQTFAEDRIGKSGWQVSFDGSKMTNNFTPADIDNEIYSLLPGDTIELTITVKNTFDGQADWYLENKVLETLEMTEDEDGNTIQKASGGAYDYLLTYTSSAGVTTPLYSSEKFGGDGRYEGNGIGLERATEALDDWFYLERLGNGGTGVVKLKVALDGETLVNDYQDTLAALQMNFATELVQPGTTTTTRTQTPGRNREIIKTGDQSQILLYILLALGSGLLLLLLAFMRMRREKEELAWEAEGSYGLDVDSAGDMEFAECREEDGSSEKDQAERGRQR